MSFEVHYTKKDLRRVFDSEFHLPDEFYLGAATAGFQVEGGYNGPDEPKNDWYFLEKEEKVERCGHASQSIRYHNEDARAMELMNLNMYRMGVEWARIQPSADISEDCSPPPFDDGAVKLYARIISTMMDHGLEPLITLHHFVHPLWAGIDLWIDREKVKDLFSRYIARTVEGLNNQLIKRHKKRPIKFWITLNELNLLAPSKYLDGRFPHRARRGMINLFRASRNLLYAHCLAYDLIHRIYKEKGWPSPMVSTNINSSRMYNIDKFIVDLLCARENNVAGEDLGAYIRECYHHWEDTMSRIPLSRIRMDRLRRRMERVMYFFTRRLYTSKRYHQTIDDIYTSENPVKLDFLSLDYYDPFPASQLGIPDKGNRLINKTPNLVQDFWYQVLNPLGLYYFLKAYSHPPRSKPIMIAESGMCYKYINGRCYPRRDGARRDDFFKAYLFECMRAINDGVNLIGYLHWSLVDNYEWGSYTPRFGIFRVNYDDQGRRSPRDCFGVNAAGAYATLAGSLRSGSKKDIIRSFASTYFPTIHV